MKRFLIGWSVVTIFGLTVARGSDADMKAEKQAAQKKESYLQKAEGEVQEWTAKLKSLQERSEKSGAKTREELDRHIKAVDEHLATARKKLEELRASSEGAWYSLRRGLDKALNDVNREYRKAVAFFNKDEQKGKKGEGS